MIVVVRDRCADPDGFRALSRGSRHVITVNAQVYYILLPSRDVYHNGENLNFYRNPVSIILSVGSRNRFYYIVPLHVVPKKKKNK